MEAYTPKSLMLSVVTASERDKAADTSGMRYSRLLPLLRVMVESETPALASERLQAWAVVTSKLILLPDAGASKSSVQEPRAARSVKDAIYVTWCFDIGA